MAASTQLDSPGLDVSTGLPAGLSSTEADRRFREFGPNEPISRKMRLGAFEPFLLLLNPLVVILLLAAVLAGFIGQTMDAVIIVTIVAVGAAINFWQTYRARIAVERLNTQIAPTATVLRDGAWLEIQRRAVVPGDVVRLSAGDLVPADAELLAARNLFVQEAALTGESAPVEKEVAGTSAQAGSTRVYLGTSVVSGTATANVLATGQQTAFGSIALRLAARPVETAFDRGLRHFSLLITRAVIFLVLVLIVASIALHRDTLQSVLFAVSLAVGLTPEFLPMITAVTLSRGAVTMARKSVIVKHLSAIQNLGSIDVLCSDKTGTLTTGHMELHRSVDPLGNSGEQAFTLARINSACQSGIRSPLDAAILEHPCDVQETAYKNLDEIPFDFERRRVSVVVDYRSERLLITKGSPEGILPLCSTYGIFGTHPETSPDVRAKSLSICEEFGQQGYRVLAVAYHSVPKQARYSVADENDLTLAGFVLFGDPVRDDAAAALAALRREGVEIKIITGDNGLVARHVCQQVGLNAGQIVLGDDLEKMSDSALGHVAEQTSVFARISPAQKNRIIRALKRRSHVVGFMGDGINDAPSLREADVGISVASAVDVARDAADVIMLKPGLHVLHEGIIAGRQAFGNVMKYLFMGTSSNFGNMLSMAGASFFLPFLPMLPSQILLNNFLYDIAQITIPTDNVDRAYLRKPQHWDIGLIRKFMLLIGPISSVYDALTFFVLLVILRAGEAEFHTGWFVESLATQTLVLFVIRTMKNPLRSRPSRALTWTTLSIVGVGIALPFSPLSSDLGFAPLPAVYFLFLTVATITYLSLVQLAKNVLVGGSQNPTIGVRLHT